MHRKPSAATPSRCSATIIELEIIPRCILQPLVRSKPAEKWGRGHMLLCDVTPLCPMGAMRMMRITSVEALATVLLLHQLDCFVNLRLQLASPEGLISFFRVLRRMVGNFLSLSGKEARAARSDARKRPESFVAVEREPKGSLNLHTGRQNLSRVWRNCLNLTDKIR